MFFKSKVKDMTGTDIEVEINRYNTQITIFDKSIQEKTSQLSLNYGFKAIIECAYNEARFFNKDIPEMDLESFLSKHYNKVYSGIINYIRNIEFSILCRTTIPSKVDNVYVSGEGATLFFHEFKKHFNNCSLI